MKKFISTLALILAAASLYAQQRVSGVVKDRASAPIIGATVVIDGTTKGVVTGVDGKPFCRHSQRMTKGDVNMCLMHTAMGKTLTLKHNVCTPCPYDRGNLYLGTMGIFKGIKFPEKAEDAYTMGSPCQFGWLDKTDGHVSKFFDFSTLEPVLENIVGDVDIYSPTIFLLNNEYTSPLSSIAPTFYHFFISDTTVLNNDTCVVLTFTTANRRDLGLSILLIAHDLAVVKNVCDRICVMEKGLFVDCGDAADVFDHPQSDYTKRLLSAVPCI